MLRERFHVVVNLTSDLRQLLNADCQISSCSYLDIESVVSLTLYGLLMKDFKALCVDRTIKSIDNVNIDSEMLGLAYLFSELDKEWDNYIAPR